MKKNYTPAGGGLQVRRGKNPRQRESLDNDKDKTDSATTNKQDPQDTPAGRRIWVCLKMWYTPKWLV